MRGKGEGAVFKRSDGMWIGSIELPPRPGVKRPRKTVSSKDKGTAIRKLNALKAHLLEHGDLPTSDQTVAQWFEYWLRTEQMKLRPKTWANYVSISRKWIIPTIGKVRLDRTTPAHVRRVHDAMTDAGRSTTSALAAHAIMSSAFADAMNDGRMTRNPAKLTDPPRRQITALEALTVNEASQMIAQFKSQAEATLWVTVLLTGGRRGEVLGLTWDRVTDVIDLSWQLQRHPVAMVAPPDYEYHRLDGGLYLTRPKSQAGVRIVPLVDPLRSILERWREIAPINPHNLLFATDEGRPIDPDEATRAWKIALQSAGIQKRIRLHDLRHTAVDMLYEAGVPEPIIIELVGHSSRTRRAATARSSPTL
jgi:integrase